MTPKRGVFGRARKYSFDIILWRWNSPVQSTLGFWTGAEEIQSCEHLFILLDDLGHFRICYFAFDACRRGFLASCRPIIFPDGCYLKTKFGVILLTAIGMASNDCIFPCGFCFVEVEDTSSGKWFLIALMEDLGTVHNTHYVRQTQSKIPIFSLCIFSIIFL